MAAPCEVVIVSVYGRGHWLASELSAKGLKVNLVDVSNSMGRWAPEDWEGPFGYFSSEKMKPTQVARLNEEDYNDPIDQGFTIWTKEGPLDLKGPMSSFLLERSGLDPIVKKYLSDYNSMSLSEIEDLQRTIARMPFSKTWLVHLAHQFGSTSYLPNYLSIENGHPCSLFSPWYIRRVTRKGFSRSLEWVESFGANVDANAKITDIMFEGRTCQGIEVEGERSGAILGQKFIWLLSSEETEYISKDIALQLFPKGSIKSEWCWMRYQIQLGQENLSESLPISFVFVNDLGLAWTHDNFLSVQKTVNPGVYDVWLKIPSHHRFQRSYVEEIGMKACDHIQKRIPRSKPELVQMPQDYMYDFESLGPSRFPVYGLGDVKGLSRRSIKNFSFGGPEVWDNYEWDQVFQSQSIICDELIEWKKSIIESSNQQGARP